VVTPRPMLPCIALLHLTPTQTQICTVELPPRIPIRHRRPLPSNKAVPHTALPLPLPLNSITRHLLLLRLRPWPETVNIKHTDHHRITIISGLLHPHRPLQCTTCRDNRPQLHRMIHLLLHLLRLHLIGSSINRTILFLLALPTSLI
jgi:hypothetical protein